MEHYEQPQAELVLFQPCQALASQTVTEPTLGEGFEIGTLPEVSEGVEDW